jgi:thioredoxin 1
MSSANFLAVTDATFADQVLGAGSPVLLKFEADWCAPCQAMKPMMAEIAEQYADKLTIATLNVDENNQTPYKLGVRGVPTVMLFRDGKVVGQKVGMPRKAELTTLIDDKLR